MKKSKNEQLFDFEHKVIYKTYDEQSWFITHSGTDRDQKQKLKVKDQGRKSGSVSIQTDGRVLAVNS